MAAASAVAPPPQPQPQPTSATPSKRPRLSLQINSKVTNTPNIPSTRPNARGYTLNPSDPTAFNTLSNAYVTAIERSSTPVTEAPGGGGGGGEPMTAINTLQSFTLSTPTTNQRPRVVTPFVATCPETPVSAHPDSPNYADTPKLLHEPTASASASSELVSYPSAVTSNTPPLSAGGNGGPPTDNNSTDGNNNVFVFSARDTGRIQAPSSPSRTRGTSYKRLSAPYTHPSSLHSILRNSPLATTRRQQARRVRDNSSTRNAANPSKRVGYNSPLEREIVTNKYTKSHIDLLIEEASPCTPNGEGGAASTGTLNTEMVDIARAFTGSEIEDGGQTPGPFEDPRRGDGRGGIRKRRRAGGGEKKRHWVWTIGRGEDGDEDEDGDEHVGGAIAALKAAQAREGEAIASAATSAAVAAERRHERTSSVDSSSSAFSAVADDVDMSDADSVETADTAFSVGAEREDAKD